MSREILISPDKYLSRTRRFRNGQGVFSGRCKSTDLRGYACTRGYIRINLFKYMASRAREIERDGASVTASGDVLVNTRGALFAALTSREACLNWEPRVGRAPGERRCRRTGTRGERGGKDAELPSTRLFLSLTYPVPCPALEELGATHTHARNRPPCQVDGRTNGGG